MKRLYVIIIACSILLLTMLLQQNTAGLIGKSAAASPSTMTDDTNIHLPAVIRPFSPDPPRLLFGLQTYGSTDVNSPFYPYLTGSQASWVRTRIEWEFVEPEDVDPADYNWAAADSAVAAARPDKGWLNLIITIERLPSWARLNPDAYDGPIHPDALDDFAEFLTALVERYDGDGYRDAPGQPVISHWELFNEPDANGTRWGGDGTEYAAMLKVAYPAIKAANPDAKVLFGGIAYDGFDYQGGTFDSDFLDDVLSGGGGAYFDVMNFHAYPQFAPNWDSQSTGLREKTAVIRANLAEYGLDKPIVISESGMHNSTDRDSSDAKQIDRMVQLVTHAYAANVDVLVWFMLYDAGHGLLPYGLIKSSDPPEPKAAYTAYQSAVDQLEEASYIRDLKPDETGVATMEAYRFSTADGPLYIAWINPYETDEVHALRIPGTEATLLNAMGELRPSDGVNLNPVKDHDGDGYVSVNLTNRPLYIQVTP